MFPRLAMPGFIASLVLFVATALLLARSYFSADAICYRNSMNCYQLTSNRASLELNLEVNYQYLTNVTGWQWWSMSPATVGPRISGRSGLIDFTWKTIRYAPLFGQTSDTVICFPIWTFLPFLVLGMFLILRMRRKARWRIRDDVRGSQPRLRRRVIRFVLFSTAGAATGAIAAELELTLGLYRQLWVSAGVIPVALMTVLIVINRRRILWRKTLLWMSLEVAGSACFFAATAEQLWHHFDLVHPDQPDFLLLAFFFGVASFFCSTGALVLLQTRTAAIKPGAYCPTCGYCLIGVPAQICPECGNPFTLDELGIEPHELVPPSA
jgi:hypothetical protein